MMNKKKLYEVLIILLIVVLIALPNLIGSEGIAYETGEDGETIPSLTRADLNRSACRSDSSRCIRRIGKTLIRTRFSIR